MAFNNNYSGLFEPEQEEALFDVEDFNLRKKKGIPAIEGKETVDVEEMLKALKSLEDEKESVRGRNWYKDFETVAEREGKHGTIPEQVAEIPEGGEWNPSPGELDDYMKYGMDDEKKAPSEYRVRSMPQGLDKPKSVSASSTKVARIAEKKGKPEGASVSKDTVTVSAGKPEKESSIPWSWKKKGPTDSAISGLPGNPFEGGVEEDEATWGALGLLGGAGSLAKGLIKKGAKEIPESLGSASKTLWDKMKDMGGSKKDLMFGEVAGKKASDAAGNTGRRLDLISEGKVGGNAFELPRGEGNRASVFRVPQGSEDVTNITRSDLKTIIKQLTDALNSGALTPEKYKQLLKRLGRSETEIQTEIARAFRK